MSTFCLSLHAGYRCRHVGACCSAHWVVAAEEQVVRFVQSSRLQPARATGDLFVRTQSTKARTPELSIAKAADGACVFRENRRCALQIHGGDAVQPRGCRHYPRVIRRDAQGIALSLSHYCPTAASLLLASGPLHVVPVQPPLAVAEPIEGLDAREALPPLLRPGLLMDLESYTAWETRVVNAFSRCERPTDALSVIAAATDHLRGWRPDAAALADAVAAAFDRVPAASSPEWTKEALQIACALNQGGVSVEAPVDLDVRWAALVPAGGTPVDRVISNYLAARAFGNWVAYQGRGLRTIVVWLHACYDVLRVLVCRAAEDRGSLAMVDDVIEGIRQTDYVMVHTIDSQAFARAAGPMER